MMDFYHKNMIIYRIIGTIRSHKNTKLKLDMMGFSKQEYNYKCHSIESSGQSVYSLEEHN